MDISSSSDGIIIAATATAGNSATATLLPPVLTTKLLHWKNLPQDRQLQWTAQHSTLLDKKVAAGSFLLQKQCFIAGLVKRVPGKYV